MSIEYILVCSTGHITLADNYKLTAMSDTGPISSDHDAIRDRNLAVARYPDVRWANSPLIVTSRPHGFLIYVPSNQGDFHSAVTGMQKPPFRLSAGMRRCMERARLYRCGYLLLDADGDKLEGLRLYEW